MRAIDVHGFAGAMTLGFVQAGFELEAKMSGEGGFGVPLVEANRHLLPGAWSTTVARPVDWPRATADVVFGNPPCSGFSALSVYQRGSEGQWVDGRGVDSHLNQGMYDLVDYAADVRPQVVVYESVEQAGRRGGSLLRKLRDRLEERSGLAYWLTNVFQDNASVGGSSLRRRYFWVASQVPFGIEWPDEREVPSLLETIAHPTGDGQVVLENDITRDAARICLLAAANGVFWEGGEKVGHVTCRLARGDEVLTKRRVDRTAYQVPARCFACEDNGGEPAHVKVGVDMSWVRNIHWKTNLYAARRWHGDRPAAVATGGFLEDAIHPTLPRTMTYREEARIMGFPDAWRVQAAVETPGGSQWMGKGIPVQAGRWVAEWVREAILGSPGPYRGEMVGPRESTIDVIGAWKGRRPPGVAALGQLEVPW